MDQEVPFQVSARVCCTLDELTEKPTATQRVELVHDTLLSAFCPLPAFGLEPMDQEVPFQVSTRVCSTLDELL